MDLKGMNGVNQDTKLTKEKIMAGAPFGNNNATKNKLWSDTLRRAIAQDRGDRVRQAAERLLDEAAKGEPWAIKELADRLDGKSIQSNTLESNGGNQVTEIIVSWVSPEPRNITPLSLG